MNEKEGGSANAVGTNDEHAEILNEYMKLKEEFHE
jgi:hypothetical protein